MLALVRPLAQEVVIPGDFLDTTYLYIHKYIISQQNGNGKRLCSVDKGIINIVRYYMFILYVKLKHYSSYHMQLTIT